MGQVTCYDWCLDKVQEALDNYDAAAAKDYLAMARMWIGRNQ